jgi:hypothetical protein
LDIISYTLTLIGAMAAPSSSTASLADGLSWVQELSGSEAQRLLQRNGVTSDPIW